MFVINYLCFLLVLVQPYQPLTEDCHNETLNFQEEWNQLLINPEKPILSKKEIKSFKGLDFFPFNPEWCITAKYKPFDQPEPFLMMTTTGRERTYMKAGTLHFEVAGAPHQLTVYESLPVKGLSTENHWFVPFKDFTNGETTYGGGRYLDIKKKDLNDGYISLNFHKSYAPYCAYSEGYSCPIVPEENYLEVAIEAGTMRW
jgi:uncharacterized protein (DUF1684 family)